ncbi:MAG: TonB-dependent receptor, partial [Alistipes sp.]|nr:TonB-dependent receptor [Alistipes sp.]
INVFYIDGENLIMRVPVNGRPKNINTGRVENAGAEAQIAWRISPAWLLDANYSYLHMAYPVLASPEHKLHVGAAFAKGRWNVSTGMQYVDGLYTEVKVAGNGRYEQENFVLWNLRGSFRVCRIMDIFVKGENLLAQRYEINAGYPMPKATVMGGIDLKF